MQIITSLLRTVSNIASRLPTRNIQVISPLCNSNLSHTQFLTPATPLVNQVAGFKVKGRVSRRCAACYYVIRDGRFYNICPKRPRHKQMSMRPKPHNTWILTHASQSKVRPW